MSSLFHLKHSRTMRRSRAQRRAYLEAARASHPDKGGSSEQFVRAVRTAARFEGDSTCSSGGVLTGSEDCHASDPGASECRCGQRVQLTAAEEADARARPERSVAIECPTCSCDIEVPLPSLSLAHTSTS